MRATPSLSVCLCTYNGARYLPELLDSLARQQDRPDQIVICDDASDDGTMSLLESFARSGVCDVDLVRNAARLGINANFELAVTRARGDVLMICDQDDVWRPNKVSVLRSIFAASPDIVGAFHNCSLIDSEGAPLPHDLWERAAFTGEDRGRLNDGDGLGYLIRHPRIAGHTLAFAARRKELVLPFARRGPYDPWLSRLLVASGPLVPVEQLLVAHRLHDDNAFGVWRSMSVRRRLQSANDLPSIYRADAAGLRELAHRLSERLPNALSGPTRRDLDAKVAHLERRAVILESTRPHAAASAVTIATELLTMRYHRYSNGWASAGYDLARSLLTPAAGRGREQ